MQATAHGDNIAVIPHPLKAILYSTRLGIRPPEDLQGKHIGMERGDMLTGGMRSQRARAARRHHGHEQDHQHDSDMRSIALSASRRWVRA